MTDPSPTQPVVSDAPPEAAPPAGAAAAAPAAAPPAAAAPASLYFALDGRDGSDPRVKVSAPVLAEAFDVPAVVEAISRLLRGEGGDGESGGGGGTGEARQRDATTVCEAVAAAVLVDRDMAPTSAAPLEALEFIVPEVRRPRTRYCDVP